MKNTKGKNSIAMFIIISTNLVCKAQVSNFGKAYVDSNTYSYVTSATASSYATTAKVIQIKEHLFMFGLYNSYFSL